MRPAEETVALVVAAGRGERAGQGPPKQYRLLGGRSVLAHSLATFLAHPMVNRVVVVIDEAHRDLYRSLALADDKLMTPVRGGSSRQESVRLGLEALDGGAPSRVLVHDAARPFLSPALVDRVAGALDRSDAVVPVLPVTSTLKRVDANGRVDETVSRDGLFAAETPQGFAFAPILAAHQRAAREGKRFTDDAAVAEWAGIAVSTVPGEAGNVKLTTEADFADAERRFGAGAGEVRVGVGYDIHALGAGYQVVLGGVAIPHSRGLVGHSDADVVLHALTDAILGAIGDGDIGEHFPPSDPQWKDAASKLFLADAVARVTARGGSVTNLDVTVIAEGPKLAPHREAMRARIAAIAGITPEQVGVKATTSEGLGFIGRSEGIAAHAVATIRLPASR
jgi:2-C-methyl-D-erythritol 4-phosphate cytidylyltransferase/2-C-methyl-D-erythritol 2,4-cyclodiphosphate synthase